MSKDKEDIRSNNFYANVKLFLLSAFSRRIGPNEIKIATQMIFFRWIYFFFGWKGAQNFGVYSQVHIGKVFFTAYEIGHIPVSTLNILLCDKWDILKR